MIPIQCFYDHSVYFDQEANWGGIGVLIVPDPPIAPPDVGEPTGEDRRVVQVPCDDPCQSCGRQLVSGEDILCAACAEIPVEWR